MKSKKIKVATTMLVAVVMIAFMSIATAVNASPPNPPPDCPQTPFLPMNPATGQASSPGMIAQMITPDGCVIEFEFWYRFACGIWYDIYLGTSKIIGGPAHCKLDNAMFNNIRTYIVGLWAAGILPDVPPFPVIPNCDEPPFWSEMVWRFFNSSCAITVEYRMADGTRREARISCGSGSAYCVTTYRYCWREDKLHADQDGPIIFGKPIGCPDKEIGFIAPFGATPPIIRVNCRDAIPVCN